MANYTLSLHEASVIYNSLSVDDRRQLDTHVVTTSEWELEDEDVRAEVLSFIRFHDWEKVLG